MNDLVIITCYRTTETRTRADAIRFYTEGVLACEGAECDRYADILSALMAGETVINAD